MEPAENCAAGDDDDIKRSIEALFKEADGRPVSELLARHNRERLFVRPLFWDYRQPALLQCRFLPCMRPAPPMPTAPPPTDECWYPLYPEDETEVAESLHRYREPLAARDSLNSRYFLDHGCQSEHVKFYYGQRPLCHVGYARCIGRGVCYLDTLVIQSLRDRRGRRRSNARRRFTPPTSMPDPYIAAVCIAVAQSQRLWEEMMAEFEDDEEDDDDTEAAQAQQPGQDAGGQERNSPAREAQAIPVVVVVHEGEHLAVFTANVTPAFFAKLDYPQKPPPPDAFMDIYQQRVKFLPYETFAGRFAGAVRDTRHRCGPGGQHAGQSSSADQEGKGAALLCSTSDNSEGPMPLSLAAEPGETDMKRKHSDGADQCKAGLEENLRPSNTKKRREVHDT